MYTKVVALLLTFVIHWGCTSSRSGDKNNTSLNNGESHEHRHSYQDSTDYNLLIDLRSSYGTVFWEGLLSISKKQENDFWNENDLILSVVQFVNQDDLEFPLNEEQEKLLIFELSTNLPRDHLKSLKYWCLAAQNFELLREYELTSDEEILEAFYKIDPLKNMIDSSFLTKNQSIHSLSSYQLHEIEKEVITYLSYLPEDKQLDLYGKMYLALSRKY